MPIIREVKKEDAGRITEIYNHYIEHTVITFEEKTLSVQETEQRIQSVTDKGFPYIVLEKQGRIIGYAYLNNWRQRSAYDITLESSVYLDKDMIGSGFGSILYAELIERSRAMKLHSLIGSISLPNDESRHLHEKFGFVLVGNFRECGLKFGRLVDVEFWQLFL